MSATAGYAYEGYVDKMVNPLPLFPLPPSQFFFLLFFSAGCKSFNRFGPHIEDAFRSRRAFA